MALLKVLHFPDPKLRQKTKPVDFNDNTLKTFIDDLLETMYAEDGVGLAATQVGDNRRIAVVDVSEKRNEPFILINAKIIEKEGTVKSGEGCLSIPGIYEEVVRAAKIKTKTFLLDGSEKVIEAEGLFAFCIQHELDHLEGKLFIDRLSQLKRAIVRRKYEKIHRTTM